MSENKVYAVPAELAQSALINAEQYRAMYDRSINDADAFWAEQAEAFLSWSKNGIRCQKWDYSSADIQWFLGGRLNVSYNCLGPAPSHARRAGGDHLGKATTRKKTGRLLIRRCMRRSAASPTP